MQCCAFFVTVVFLDPLFERAVVNLCSVMMRLPQVLPAARLEDSRQSSTRSPPISQIHHNFQPKSCRARLAPSYLLLPARLRTFTHWQVLMGSEEKATGLLPSSQLIKQTLAYAKDLCHTLSALFSECVA
jgi:hypothetical protein